jgi:transcriptional regulator
MYSPASFQVRDQTTILSFIERYEFATLVTATPDNGILITHIPLLLNQSRERLILQGHVARPNPHWHHFDGTTPSIAIFHGPHAYISPGWYENRPAVPTWNYAVVHAHGCPKSTDEHNVTLAILQGLVKKTESHRSRPWRMEDLPPGYYHQMANQIVAFEMPIDKFEAKFKLGQNQPEEDREGTIKGLMAEGSADTAALVAFMREQAGGAHRDGSNDG